MCGIIGVVQHSRNINNLMLDGLKRLQYRGYDSSGVCCISDGSIVVNKKAGKIEELEKMCKSNPLPSSNIGLAHCRWATQGFINDTNAHPHVVGDIVLVHNGIIENYFELKDYILQNSNNSIVSDTDTEIIAHLINIEDGNMYEKVSKSILKLKGSYAIAVISSKEPDKIIVAKQHSPLVLGSFGVGNLVSSDIQAILPHTNDIMVLLDGDVGIITKDRIEIYNSGKKIDRESKKVSLSVKSSHINGYDTYMKKEIEEQPTVIYDTMLRNDWQINHNRLSKLCIDHKVNDVVFLACGTSYHACLLGASLMERFARIRTSVKLASEFAFNNFLINDQTLVVAVSQSGETADTISAVKQARSLGAKVLSIINVSGSALERESDCVLYTAAGPEISVASTKAFLAQLTVLYMLAAIIRHLDTPYQNIKDNMLHYIYNEMGMIPEQINKIFELDQNIKKIAEKIHNAKSVFYIGRGLGVPIAYEGALKLKEISYIHAEGLAAGELKHGSLALIEQGMPVIAIATKNMEYDKIISNIREVKSRGAFVVAVAIEDDKDILKIVDETIYIPKVDDIFIPMLAVVPLQLLAYHISRKLGRDIDKPRNLAKSVSVE